MPSTQDRPQILPTQGFVRVPQLLAALPVSRSTLWKMVSDGRFPEPVRPSPFGPSVTVWSAAEVHEWIRKALAARAPLAPGGRDVMEAPVLEHPAP
jgi:predicted DNA-binding transcriptional regulator AlpA